MMRIFTLTALLCMGALISQAQPNKTITRIARITVDPSKLAAYKVFLKEQMDAAIKLEPGVLSYTVYADKTNPAVMTLVEVYASNEAYLAHREAPHFKKYKAAVEGMVKSLELSEVEVMLVAKKE